MKMEYFDGISILQQEIYVVGKCVNMQTEGA